MKNKNITTDTVRRLDGQTVGQSGISIREISARLGEASGGAWVISGWLFGLLA